MYHLSPKSLRQAIWDNGYRPVAIPSGVKFPVEGDWQELAQLDPPYVIQRDPNEARPSTGILANGLRPLDFDIDNAKRDLHLNFLLIRCHGRVILPGASVDLVALAQ